LRDPKLHVLALTAALLGAAPPAPARAEEARIEPRAAEILRAMTRYLNGLERFAVETDNAIDVVLESGQKLQFENPVKLSVKRPNRLRAERVGDLVDQVFFYDGAELTLHDRGRGYYATVAAPPTLDAALDFARDSLDIVAPAADLLYRDAFEALTQDASSGVYLGPSMVGGVRCHHLAFTGLEVDWQLWVQEGEQPLPRKYVITSKRVAGAPEFAVWMQRWDLGPPEADDAFRFVAPEQAQRIEFLELTAEKPAGVEGVGGKR
jgi:hypothetical protein